MRLAKTMMTRLATAYSLLAATALVACGSGDDLGLLKVHWVVGGSTCSGALLTEARVHVLDDDVDIITPAPTANCVDGASGVVLPEVPAGTYTIWVEGLDASGKSFYDGRREGVKVKGGEQTVGDPPVSLAMKKAALRLKWRFANGGLCSGNAVAEMDVSVFDTTSNVVFNDTTLCDPPVTSDNPEGGVLVTDLRGNEELSVAVYGLDAENKRIYVGKASVTTSPGETTEVMVSLSECAETGPCQ